MEKMEMQLKEEWKITCEKIAMKVLCCRFSLTERNYAVHELLKMYAWEREITHFAPFHWKSLLWILGKNLKQIKNFAIIQLFLFKNRNKWKLWKILWHFCSIDWFLQRMKEGGCEKEDRKIVKSAFLCKTSWLVLRFDSI